MFKCIGNIKNDIAEIRKRVGVLEVEISNLKRDYKCVWDQQYRIQSLADYLGVDIVDLWDHSTERFKIIPNKDREDADKERK